MRISDWSSDVCSSDLPLRHVFRQFHLKRSLLPNFSKNRKPASTRARSILCVCAAIDELPTGGASRDRTDDPLLAKQVLSQLSYGPVYLAWTRLRSEEHTSELQSLMRSSYAVFCLKKNK